MQSVGAKIREARLASGRSLEDVSAKTRINLKNLEAIENDDLSKISSPFFYKSFARQYAEELKLNFTSIAEDIRAAADTMPTPLVPGEAEDPTLPKVAPLRSRRTKGLRSLYSLLSLILVLASCSFIYGFWQNSRSHMQDVLSTWISSVHSYLLSPNTNSSDRTASVSQNNPHSPALPPLSTPAIELPQLTEADEPARVELSASEPSWLSMIADGKETFAGILSAAQTRFFEGHKLRLRTGNAGALIVVFNGKALGPIGERGQVKTVVFSNDGYRFVQGSSTAHLMLTGFNPSGE